MATIATALPRVSGGGARRAKRASATSGYLFVLPALGFFGVFVLYPMLRAVYLSFTSYSGIGAAKFTGIDNFKALVHDPLFWHAFEVTVILTVAGAVLQTAFGMGVAILLNHNWKGSIVFRTIAFMPAIISLTVSGILWQLMLSPQYGIVNKVLRDVGLGGLAQPWLGNTSTVIPAVIVVSLWQGFGFFMLIFYAGLQGIDQNLYESARVDGAGKVREIWNITVPLLRPITEVVVMLNVINGLKVFDIVYVMTQGGPGTETQTLATYLYALGFGGAEGALPAFGYADAVGLFVFVVAALATFLLYKFRRGAYQ